MCGWAGGQEGVSGAGRGGAHTSVELFGRFFPRRWASSDAPTGSNACCGLELTALNVACIAPWWEREELT